ncbi:hypothetical protein Slala05_78560 [Streptomyces lavendulae subsp. lavendulae]|nr:hypothetical protein Slala05_78560 [Streptomyces lavendulae subsp. lavendulae]
MGDFLNSGRKQAVQRGFYRSIERAPAHMCTLKRKEPHPGPAPPWRHRVRKTFYIPIPARGRARRVTRHKGVRGD